MKLSWFPWAALWVPGLVSCSRPHEAAEKTLRSLNVVVITIDTLRPDHLRCYGDSRIETPNLDRIAQGGVLFENAVTQSPLTPPSHASIFTGLNPPAHKVRDTGGFVLSPSTPTLATFLQQRGWETGAFISSAVLKKRFGFDQGFAVYDDRMPRPGKGQEYLEDAERRAGDTVDRAVGWLAQRTNRPFFLWVHLYDPHTPYNPPPPFSERYRDRPYDGEIAYADREIGRLLDTLQQRSLAGNTLLAVLSDHGESLGEHGEYSHGVFLYDATLRIAFLLSGPGVPAGMRVKQQARTIDLLPTIVELLGGRTAASVEGSSLIPLFTGKDSNTEISYAETLFPKITMGWAELRGIRTNRWKYIRAPKPELYDLSQDPGETRNVLADHSDVVRKLEAQLAAASRAPGSDRVETTPIDERTRAQLKSLGYTAGFTTHSYNLDGQGADPKDRVAVLKLMDSAEQPESRLSPARRIELLQQAVAMDPRNQLLYHSLGAKLEKAGRYDDAMKLYRAALGRGIEDGRLHSRLGDLLVRAGKKAEAIPEYEKAAQLNPADAASQANLGTAYIEAGRLNDAERVFKAIAAIEPANAAAQNGLGVLAIQRQDGNAARVHFEKAVELDPDLVEAQLNLGLLYKMAGDRGRARSCFEQFLAKASPRQYKEVIPKVRAELAELAARP
jgi:arylsulfatase A-like enzyme/tetratricopeptide (TPR) repeat protein